MCLFSITLTYISYCHFDVSYLVKPIFVLARYIYIYIYIYILLLLFAGPLIACSGARLLQFYWFAILMFMCLSFIIVGFSFWPAHELGGTRKHPGTFF